MSYIEEALFVPIGPLNLRPGGGAVCKVGISKGPIQIVLSQQLIQLPHESSPV